jgi:hypothetical protein
MKWIKNWKTLKSENNFSKKISIILEGFSTIITSDELIDVLEKIKANRIADELLNFLNKEKIETSYNYLHLTDKDDEIGFLPDNQFQRLKMTRQDYKTKIKSNIKIGKLINTLFSENDMSFTKEELDDFINKFKAANTNFHNKNIEIVEGDEIAFWYNEENYLYKDEGGTLCKSCMRESYKSHWFKIYTENPDKVKMVIMTYEGKLLGRALLWKLDSGESFLDRIYTRFPSDEFVIDEWTKKNYKGLISYQDEGAYLCTQDPDEVLTVSLQQTNFEEFPYADTLCYLYQKLEDGKVSGPGFVSNKLDKINGYLISKIQSHLSGKKAVSSHVWSNTTMRWISKSV